MSHFPTGAECPHWWRHVDEKHCNSVLYVFLAQKWLLWTGKSTYTCSFCWHCGSVVDGWLTERESRRDLNIRSHDTVLFPRMVESELTAVSLSCKKWAAFITRQIRDLLWIQSTRVPNSKWRRLPWATAYPKICPSNKSNPGSLVCLISSKWLWYAPWLVT